MQKCKKKEENSAHVKFGKFLELHLMRTAFLRNLPERALLSVKALLAMLFGIYSGMPDGMKNQ